MDYTIFGASVQGWSHIHNHDNCPNQDRIFGRTYQIKDPAGRNRKLSVVVLADGVGSEALAEYGAETAVHTAAEYARDNFYKIVFAPNTTDAAMKIKIDLMSSVRASLSFIANRLKTNIDSLASTLLLAASDGEQFFVFSCGDSVMVLHDNQKNKFFVCPPTYKGNFVGETIVIGEPTWASACHIARGNLSDHDIDAFILMSDGIAETAVNYEDEVYNPHVLLGLLCDVGNKSEREMSEELEDDIIRHRSDELRDDLSVIIMVDKNFNNYGKRTETIERLSW